MTAPSEGNLREEYLANRAVPHMSQRLGKDEKLNQIEAGVGTPASLLGAAEQCLQERSAALSGMQANIEALLGEKSSADNAQRHRMVGLYETMKPKEAAIILEGLDSAVLTSVARAMNPRKMAAILAELSLERVGKLTISLA